MYSDSEDEIFCGPLTMFEIKLGFGVVDKKNISGRQNETKINHKMESNRNSIIEISSEENSFSDDKENTNPIPTMKNISLSNNIENVITKLEDTSKNKLNECSSLSTNSDNTKSISSSFLEKLVECMSEGNENYLENIHLNRKKNVQLSPSLSRIDEVQSFNTNQPSNLNTSNKCNKTFDLVIDISNSSLESEHEVELNDDQQETKESKDEVISKANNDNINCISSINNDAVVFEQLGRISPINYVEVISKTNNEFNNDEIIPETDNSSRYYVSSISNDEAILEYAENCISSLNNDENLKNCISPINNDEAVSEALRDDILSTNNDEFISEKFNHCISPLNNDEADSEALRDCILATNNCEIPSEKSNYCISSINMDEVSENIENGISSINNVEIVSEKLNSPTNKEIDLINSQNLNTMMVNKEEEISKSPQNCIPPVNKNQEISEQLGMDNKIEHRYSPTDNLGNMKIKEVENVSYEDDFEDIDSLDEMNNTFSECTLNSANENKENGNDDIIQVIDEVQTGGYEDEIKKIVYSGYADLKINDAYKQVDKIENIFFDNRPESDVELQDQVNENHSEDLNQQFCEETDEVMDNKIGLNGSILDQSNTSSLGCEEINSSIEHEDSERFLSFNRKFSDNSTEHPKLYLEDDSLDNHLKQANSSIEEVQLVNRKFSMSPIEHVHSKLYHQNNIDKESIEESKEQKFTKDHIEHLHPKLDKQNHNFDSKSYSSIDEFKESKEQTFSEDQNEHVHPKLDKQNHDIDSKLNSSVDEFKEAQSVNRKYSTSPIEHVHRKPHRQTEIIDNNWKKALALSNDTLIDEQSMIPTSITLLENTNIQNNLNSSENKHIYKSSMIPTILEKSERSIDLTCSEKDSTLNESHNANESYSTAFEDSETECNNTLDMIDRLLKMEAAANTTSVQSTEKPKKIDEISPRKSKMVVSNVNPKIPPVGKLQTSKTISKPSDSLKPIVKPKINSPLKTTPKSYLSTPSRLGLQKGSANSKIQSSQSKISPLVKNAIQSRTGFGLKTPTSANKNISTKTNINSPRIISPIPKTLKEAVLKPSSASNKNLRTKVNVDSPKVNSPLVNTAKEFVSKSSPSVTKPTSVDSPITAEVNELTESFDQGKAESSFVQLRSALRRQLSDLYIEPSSTDKRVATKPKQKVISNVEAKKTIFKTPTVPKVLKSTEKSKMSKNIMSPVDFYINKAPQSPLVVKCDYSKRQPKHFDNEKDKTTKSNDVASIGNPLPFCAYKSASNVKLVEDKTNEVPKCVRKFFPTVQYVIKHESRIKTEERKSCKPHQQSSSKINNDSLNALDNSLSIFNASAGANDVSVRVKKSALRTPK